MIYYEKKKISGLKSKRQRNIGEQSAKDIKSDLHMDKSCSLPKNNSNRVSSSIKKPTILNPRLFEELILEYPRTKNANSESLETYYKGKKIHSCSLSPKNFLYGSMSTNSPKQKKLQKSKTRENKEKVLKNIKDKIYDSLYRNNSNSKLTTSTRSIKEDKKEIEKNQLSKEKVIKNKRTEKKVSTIKQKIKKLKKKPLAISQAHNKTISSLSITKTKNEIALNISSLTKRINEEKNKTNHIYKKSIKEVIQAIIKIQSHIRGYLVRKIFSKYFKRNRVTAAVNIEILKKKRENELIKNFNSLEKLKRLKTEDEIEIKKIINSFEEYHEVAEKLDEMAERRYSMIENIITKKIGKLRDSLSSRLEEKEFKLYNNSDYSVDRNEKESMTPYTDSSLQLRRFSPELRSDFVKFNRCFIERNAPEIQEEPLPYKLSENSFLQLEKMSKLEFSKYLNIIDIEEEIKFSNSCTPSKGDILLNRTEGKTETLDINYLKNDLLNKNKPLRCEFLPYSKKISTDKDEKEREIINKIIYTLEIDVMDICLNKALDDPDFYEKLNMAKDLKLKTYIKKFLHKFRA